MMGEHGARALRPASRACHLTPVWLTPEPLPSLGLDSLSCRMGNHRDGAQSQRLSYLLPAVADSRQLGEQGHKGLAHCGFCFTVTDFYVLTVK